MKVSEDDDPRRSEGVLCHTICNVSKFSGTSISNAITVRGLQWSIMITVKKLSIYENRDFMGYFLVCSGDQKCSSWNCYARARLILHSQNQMVPHMCKKITHLFHQGENDWGFSNFKLWSDVIDPCKGYAVNDSILLETHFEADIPHGVNWDSKKLTGYVGLKNQGATCYMNSLLQTLFFTNQFRKAVYRIPIRGMESVAFALQWVFYGLQCSEVPVDTRILTTSFGWRTSDTLRQQDVHEFLRLLVDKLEGMIENTPMKGSFSHLFEGEMISTIACKYVNYASSRTETFYDIQLNVIGKRNILDSLDDYVAPEILEGENRYDAGSYGLQEAEKKVVFSRFPPVLYLHLMRFHYDPVTDSSVKCNDRVEFPEQLNLHDYMLSSEPAAVVYCLHSILVHSGNNVDGHYVVYINPELKGNWYIFDDDMVCRCSKSEAIDGNFGGEASLSDGADDGLGRHNRNAYVLVYIQESQIKNILKKVTEKDIPVDLMNKLLNKIKLEDLFYKGNTGYTTVQIVLEDSFIGHEGKGLFNPKTVRFISFYISQNAVLKDFAEGLSEFFKFPKEQMRVWPINEHNCPIFLNSENRSLMMQVRNTVGFMNPWILFLELLPPDSDHSSLPPFDPKKHVLIFFKIQLPNSKKIVYGGHEYVLLSSSASEIMKMVNEKAGFPIHTVWRIYLEVNEKNFGEMKKSRKFHLQNGDILVFQKINEDSEKENLAEEMFKVLNFPIDIKFCDIFDPDAGLIMKTYSNVCYDDFIKEMSQKLRTEPSKIQLFLPEENTGVPGTLIQSLNFNLKSLLQDTGELKTRKVFYKLLTGLGSTVDDKSPKKRLRESTHVEDKENTEKNL